MTELYEVRASPGKGLGLFATNDIKPGTVIVEDSMKLVLKRPKHRVTREQVEVMFTRLSVPQRRIFLELHNNYVAGESKLLRIYKSNAFGDETYSWIFLKFSRINHACTPNAEIANIETKESVKVIAVKPIAEDEEVFISYIGFDDGPRRFRAGAMTAVYGFQCHCIVCRLQENDLKASDGRRWLIYCLTLMQSRLAVTLPRFKDTIAGLTANDQAEMLGRSRPRFHFRPDISSLITYNFLLVALLRAEGLVGYRLAHAYIGAAGWLLTLMHFRRNVVVLPSARLVLRWVKAGIDIMHHVRGARSLDLNSVWQKWTDMRQSVYLRAARDYMQSPDALVTTDGNPAFAMQLQPRQVWSEDLCRKMVRASRAKAGLHLAHSIVIIEGMD